MNNHNQEYEEYLVYIHGVSQEYDQPHQQAYDYLHDGISACISRDVSEWHNAKRCDVEWGWNYQNDPTPEGHHLLAKAQEVLAARIFPKIKEADDFSLNPGRFILPGARELILKGFSDIFYYVSEDGQNSVRLEVLSTILEANDIQNCLAEEQPFSITLLGHSAGSVIAFDLLLYLFSGDGVDARSSGLSKKSFIDFEAPSVRNTLNRKYSRSGGNSLQENLEKLRKMAQEGKIRVRRLVTFGSPISKLAFRRDDFLEILANDGYLNPKELGLDRNPEVFGEPLKRPRWINLWDKDDIIAWPVEPLMGEQDAGLVADIYTNVDWKISTAHNQYWNSKIVHEKIAEHW
ncbi:MAG: hypothetical protein QNJ68_07610 [Microcoleaceae cyanobacterium MO_207.B10]|nr:hypothetical protein [Microcoleaceae cyanobacterium MO_207.B10]